VVKIDYIQYGEGVDISQLPKEIQEQLAILNRSQSLTMIIIAGILMRYKSMDLQKQQLICNALCPEQAESDSGTDALQMQVASSLIILYALFAFNHQSQNLLQEACESGNATKGLKLELTLSEISILIALIRFFQLVKTDENVQNSETSVLSAEELEGLEPDI